jgi:hypothetical protein
MQNLFKSKESKDLLADGNYLVELVELRPGKSQAYDGRPPKDTITFCFREVSTLAPVNRTVAATTDPRGRLLEFVRQMTGTEQPNKPTIDDGEKFTRFISQLVGKKFDATITRSDNGRFNNITSIRAAGR